MKDYSIDREWFTRYKRNTVTKHFAYKPRSLPVKLRVPERFCSGGSDVVFLLTGKFNVRGGAVDISPRITFKMERTTQIYHLHFISGIYILLYISYTFSVF